MANGRYQVAPSGNNISASCPSPFGFRYAILFITVLCLTAVCCNMIAFNFTIILMEKPNWKNIPFATNDSLFAKRGEEQLIRHRRDVELLRRLNDTHMIPATIPYSAEEKALLFNSVGIASILSTFPYSALYTKYGARYVYLSAGIMSTLSTALLPVAAAHGMIAFVAVRFIQGLAYGANFAAIGFVCHRWASLRQHGLFLACMTCFTPFSVAITNPIAAFISSTPGLGWPWVYYLFALVSALFFLLWLCLYSDHPNSHRCVAAAERESILCGKTKAEIEIHGYMPYRAILTNKLVWVVWLNAFADIVTIVFLMTYLPTYVSKVLGYGVRETGIWSALGALLHIPVKLVSGCIADTLTCISQVNGMRLFNTIALVASAVLFALVAFVPAEMPSLAVALITLNIALTGTNCGGFYKCATLTTRQYAHFVVAGIQFEKSVTLFVSPLLFLFFIHDESSRQQWSVVFLLMAFVLVVVAFANLSDIHPLLPQANTFFLFMVSDQPAEFTKKLEKRNGEKRLE